MANKNFGNNILPLLFGVAIGGFGWMAIRGFADLWVNLSPTQTLLTGIGGIIIVGWIIKSFGIKVKRIFN